MRLEEGKIKIIRDSRGNETLEAHLLAGDEWVVASVPAGRSRGSYEAFVQDPHLAAQLFTSEVWPAMREKKFEYQDEWDNFLIRLDGTENKRRLGGNLILALSLAFARLAARRDEQELYEYINRIYRGDQHTITPTIPKGIFNVINGGVHGADSNLELQEFQIIPHHSSFTRGFEAAKIFYRKLRKDLEKKFGEVFLGDEAGFSVPFSSNEQALLELWEGAGEFAWHNKASFYLGIDAAANGFFNKEKGLYKIGQENYTASELLDYYEHLIHKYGIIYLEDPFTEDDLASFAELNKRKGVYIVTDDLTATNLHRTSLAINGAVGDSIIIKPNQVGSLTETIETAKLAHRAGWQLVVSHRSGETEDDFISDLAVGLNAWGIKAGAPATEFRLEKYERLEEIEKKLARE